MEDVIRSILDVERHAKAIVAEAENKAKEIKLRAEQEAVCMKQERLQEALQFTKTMEASAREAAERERQEILAQARAQARRMEELAITRIDVAAETVVSAVLGQGNGSGEK